MKRKKSQGLPLNTIIIAILVIIVLIFTGRMSLFRQSIEDCESKGGTTSTEDGLGCYKIKDNKYCCIEMDEQT